MGKHGLRMIKMGKRRGVTVASFRLSRKQNSGTRNVQNEKLLLTVNVSQCPPNAPRVKSHSAPVKPAWKRSKQQLAWDRRADWADWADWADRREARMKL